MNDFFDRREINCAFSKQKTASHLLHRTGRKKEVGS